MIKFMKKVRLVALSLALAVAMLPNMSVESAAGAVPPPVGGAGSGGSILGGSGSSSGGWIVGGIFISAASLIACGIIVGSEENREMSREEAMLSGIIPLGCLLREQLLRDRGE